MRKPSLLTRRYLMVGGCAFAAAATALPAAARATPAADQAETVVRNLVRRMWRLIGASEQNAINFETLSAAVEQETDLSLLGRLVLGRYWRQANQTQQVEYLALFQRFMLQSFVERLRHFAGTDLGGAPERFLIVATRPVGQRDFLVQSRLTPPNGQPLRVDWRLRERQGKPVIIDLVVEGISLLVTHRTEFAAVLQRGGMDGLLTELRTRATQAT